MPRGVSQILTMECDSERIRPALFKKEEWGKNEELGKHEGLVAKRKLKKEAGITTGRIRVRASSDCSNVKSVLLPPEDNIAALDFGTTYCSLAITTVGDGKANCLKLDAYRSRVPNAILLRKLDSASSATAVPCEIRAFGNKAQATYAKLRPNEINQHLFFERIKMNLQHDPVSA